MLLRDTRKLRFVLWMVAITVILVLAFVVSVSESYAQGCSIKRFTMDPNSNYTVGVHVILRGESDCGTVRFSIRKDGTNETKHKAEIGSSNQTETWKTEEFGSGNFIVCFEARGSGGWENAARNCRTVYVEGGQAPPPGSNQGDNVRCWVNTFNVTPSAGPRGHRFNFNGQGQCDGNLRAVKFTIDGHGFGEHGGNTTRADWDSSDASIGNHEICFLATAGDWDRGARTCVNIQVLQPDQPPSNEVQQGPPSTNNQPGQTSQSNPDGWVDHSSSGNGQNSGRGLDIAAYCGGGAHFQGRDWFCDGNNRVLSMQDVCVWQYGSGAIAVNPSPDNAYGWTCEGGGGSNTNQPPAQQSGSSNSGSQEQWSSNPEFSRQCVASKLRTGDIAIVSTKNDYVRLRAQPSVDAAVLTTIPARTLITLIGGPQCVHAWQWYETQYNGFTGWIGEIGPDGQQNILRNGEPLPDSGSGSTVVIPTQQAPVQQQGSGSSSGSCRSPFSVGETVRITPGESNRLRGGASTAYQQIGTLEAGTQMVLVSGPHCNNGYVWWEIRTTDGRQGWTAEGEGNTYWIERVQGQQVLPTVTPAQSLIPPQQSRVVELVYHYTPFNYRYHFVVDLSDPNICVIVNGDAIISDEINRSTDWFMGIWNSKGAPEAINEMLAYIPTNGYIDTFRVAATAWLINETGCLRSHYKVGPATMDMSGLGNVMFGYWSFWLREWVVKGIANTDQFFKLETLFQPDFPDDSSQIDLGRAIAQFQNVYPIRAETVQGLLPVGFVNSE